MTPADRLDGIRLSLIRRMTVGAPSGCISLGLGEPGWPMPEPGRLALAGFGTDCSYGPNSGLPELQQALADFSRSVPERIMICAGSQAALFAVFQAWLSPGDSVLVPDPGFLAYPVLAQLAGATALPYTMDPTGQPDLQLIQTRISGPDKPRLLLINHPANPSGRGIDQANLRKLADLCQANGIILVSDEVYAQLWLDQPQTSLRSVSPDGIVLSSFSKAWAAPGLRVGWAEGPAELLAPARLIHNFMTTAAARPSQLAALALLNRSDSILPASRQEVADRWHCLKACLAAELGHDARTPDGGFYYWLGLPLSAHAEPVEFCLRVRDLSGVIVIPGLAFGEAGRGFVRLSFAGSCSDIREGVKRLGQVWRNA